MDEQIGSDQPQSRVKKGSSTLIYVAIVIVVLLIAGFYFYTQKGPFPPTDHEANTTADREAQFTEQAPSQAPGPGTEIEDKQPSQKPGLRQEDPTVSDVDSFQKNGTQTESPTPTASKDIPSSIRQRLSA
jgi:cytoskeletal protein RodZ